MVPPSRRFLAPRRGWRRGEALVISAPWPQASADEINEVLLATSSTSKTAVIKKPKTTAAPKTAATQPAKKAVDGAKIALELLEASTTQLLRRKGWFRDVRLRRSADALS
eukprot:Skav226366  [mRNA]  locus=scaffold290:77069:84439:+ [translate_table: standard]